VDARPTTFERFYAANWDLAIRLTTLLVGSVHEAEELAQDCFTSVSEQWDRIDNPTAYLKVALANRAKNHLRTRALRLSRGWHDESDLVGELGQSDLWDALRALPTRQRVAVVLKFYGDLSLKEIADAIGCREGTAASLVHRGVAALRKEVES
jgi:RNA polymerase sigma factor (sigma-70 family)